MKNISDTETNKILEQAWNKFDKKDFKGAEKLFLEVYEDNNDNTDGLYGYACALLRKNETDHALEMLDKLIALNPRNPKYYHTRALCYGADENFKEAIKDLEKAIEISDEKHEAYCDLGGTYLAMKNYRMAAVFYEKSVSIDGRCSEAWLGKALAAYFNKEQKAAMEFLNITLKLNPKSLLALLAKAELLIETGKGAEVEKELKKILAIEPAIFKKPKEKAEGEDEDDEEDDYDKDEDANRTEDDEIEEFDLDD